MHYNQVLFYNQTQIEMFSNQDILETKIKIFLVKIFQYFTFNLITESWEWILSFDIFT